MNEQEKEDRLHVIDRWSVDELPPITITQSHAQHAAFKEQNRIAQIRADDLKFVFGN